MGDPCYVFNEDMMSESNRTWLSILEETGSFGMYKPGTQDLLDPPTDGVFNIEGFDVFASGTQWGDGLYLDNESNRYSVDSGLIGLIPVGLIHLLGGKRAVEKLTSKLFESLGRVVVFGKDFYCETRDGDGDIAIGNIAIHTDYGDDEDPSRAYG